MRTYRCFGIDVTASLDLPGAWPAADPEAIDPVHLADGELGPWRGSGQGGWSGVCDGASFAVQRSDEGEHRFVIGGRSFVQLSADLRRLTGDLGSDTIDVWRWRALLDSVLFTVGLLRGGEALHAGAVATPDGAVAIAGPSGAGKSTLLAHLLTAHDCRLVADDILFLAPTDDAVLAHPGPPLMTVPSGAGRGPGHRLATLGEELWTAVAVVPDPVPLRRIVVLDRSGGSQARSLPVEDPFPTLMRLLLAFPRASPRAAARLALAARLAASVQLVRLQAPISWPVEHLAQLALDGTLGAGR